MGLTQPSIFHYYYSQGYSEYHMRIIAYSCQIVKKFHKTIQRYAPFSKTFSSVPYLLFGFEKSNLHLSTMFTREIWSCVRNIWLTRVSQTSLILTVSTGKSTGICLVRLPTPKLFRINILHIILRITFRDFILSFKIPYSPKGNIQIKQSWQ